MLVNRIPALAYRLGRYAWRAWHDARPAARNHGISPWRIVREQVALKRKTGLRPDEYYMFGLDDPAIPFEEKLAYISDEGRKMWYVMTPRRYHCIYRNKLIFKHVFGSMGFPVAKLYALYDPLSGHTVEGAPLRTAEDIAGWMEACDADEVVFKPVESAEGRMVFVMAGRKPGDRRAFLHVDGEEYSPERIVRELNDPAALAVAYPDTPVQRTFLVEERLHPHPEIAALTGSGTLCCVRLVTLVTLSGAVEIIATYFKVQPAAMSADNSEDTRDTLFATFDSETGRLGAGYFYYRHDPTPYTRHPNGGQEFLGRELPHWREAVALAKRAAAAFPLARTIGWDIAMTDNGPYLIEGNAAWGVRSVQFVWRRGLATPRFMEVYRHQQALYGKEASGD